MPPGLELVRAYGLARRAHRRRRWRHLRAQRERVGYEYRCPQYPGLPGPLRVRTLIALALQSCDRPGSHAGTQLQTAKPSEWVNADGFPLVPIEVEEGDAAGGEHARD